MSAGGDVYDVVDYARANGNAEMLGRSCLDVDSTPTAGMHRRGIVLPTGGNMNKSTIRSIAYFMIVGGVVVWVVGHLAPIRA